MPKHEAAPHSSNGATASRPPDGAFRNFASPARAAEVVSSNIVGYEKITVPANKMDIVGIQFQDVGVNGVIDIQQITAEGWDGEGADWIKIYDPDTSRYVTAYYMGEEAGGVYDEDGNALGPGWADDNQVAVDIEIKVGQGFWVQSEAGGKLVFPTIPAN